jgi:hypothetical protein
VFVGQPRRDRACGPPHRTRCSVDSGHGYFPRAVFFFGFGLLVLPDLPGGGSFFGRFGDTGSLFPWLALLWWLPRSRSLGGSLSPRGAIRPQIEIGKPGLPEHGAIGSPAGDGDCERLRQTRKTGEGRAPVPAAEPEPGDGGIAAVPADDLPGERVGLGRPGHSQLIASRSNNAKRVPTRACGPAPEVGLAWRPVAAWCWLTAHADASDPSHDPHPANLSAGSTRARARPCWSVTPGVGEPRLGRSKLIGTRGRSARPGRDWCRSASFG